MIDIIVLRVKLYDQPHMEIDQQEYGKIYHAIHELIDHKNRHIDDDHLPSISIETKEVEMGPNYPHVLRHTFLGELTVYLRQSAYSVIYFNPGDWVIMSPSRPS